MFPCGRCRGKGYITLWGSPAIKRALRTPAEQAEASRRAAGSEGGVRQGRTYARRALVVMDRGWHAISKLARDSVSKLIPEEEGE